MERGKGFVGHVCHDIYHWVGISCSVSINFLIGFMIFDLKKVNKKESLLFVNNRLSLYLIMQYNHITSLFTMKFKEVPPPSLGYVLIVYHAFLFYEDKAI